MSAYPGRWLVTLGYMLWAASVLYVVACLAAPSVVGHTGCELTPGSSVYGEASRTWLPPGTTCTWELSGYGRYVTSPSPVRLVVVGMALVGLPLLRYLAGLLRRPALVDA
jgi:hypothetical protein